MNGRKNRKAFIFAAVSAVGQVFLWYGLALHISSIEAIPYNLRELISGDQAFKTAVMFSMIGYLFFGSQVLSAWFLLGIKRLKTGFLWVLSCLGISGGAFMILYNTVPMESLHDVLGSPVLGWPMPWELLFRFTGLFLWLYMGLTLAAAGVMFFDSGRWRQAFSLSSAVVKVSICILLLFYSYHVVVVNACTDNLLELMRGGGDGLSFSVLCVWIIFLGWSASLIGRDIFNRKTVSFMTILWIMAAPAIGLVILYAGTAPVIQKYGTSFSAIQFLLSPDRENYISGPGLWVRYAAGHLAFSLLIVINQAPFWMVHNILSKGNQSK